MMPKVSNPMTRALFGLCLGLALCLGPLSSIEAKAASASEPSQRVSVNLATPGGASQTLVLGKGRSAIIDLPIDARDILVSNPAVAEAVLRTPRRIFVVALSGGQTDAVFFDGTGRKILSLSIRVQSDLSSLTDLIRKVAPDSKVEVQAAGDGLVLSGLVSTPAESDKIRRLAAQYVATPDKVLNFLSVAGSDQVLLKVRIVEMQRNAIKQLGFNASAVLNRVGEPQYMIGNAASFALNGRFLGTTNGVKLDTTQQPVVTYKDAAGNTVTRIDGSNPLATPTTTVGKSGLNQLTSNIQAFERAGLMRTLAEPTLSAVSGESAKFLAGGEFPIPVGVDQQGRVSVEYKSYGVGLGFTPQVMSGGRISLKLNTEMSELTTVGSYATTGGTGPNAVSINLPGLTIRRAETTVEIPSGGAMMIAGLLQNHMKQNIDSLPGLGYLPVLGTLFRSRDYISDETELVVIVIPYLVNPTSPDQLQTPGDGLIAANDAETILLGKLNKSISNAKGVPAPTLPQAPYQGPVGYVIE